MQPGKPEAAGSSSFQQFSHNGRCSSKPYCSQPVASLAVASGWLRQPLQTAIISFQVSSKQQQQQPPEPEAGLFLYADPIQRAIQIAIDASTTSY